MFHGLRKKIENNRKSRHTFWRLLIVIKDGLWRSWEVAATFLYFIKCYSLSFFKQFGDRKSFKTIETYCMFLGYPRSGHSIVGSVLDAHLNIIMAHELDALRFVRKGFSRNQIFSLLLENSKKFTDQKRVWEGYSYFVPNQWHGKFQKLKVIGDKKGESSALELRHDFVKYYKLKKKLGKIDLKLIHVYRNPYDNIATIFKKRGGELTDAIDYYFNIIDCVLAVKKDIPEIEIMDIKQEDFIKSPKVVVKNLCNFLGVLVSEQYLKDVASIVWSTPHQSRYEIIWTRDLINLVARKAQAVYFLSDYTYEG